MQTLTLSSNQRNDRLLDSKTARRLRAFRFMSERYAQRERPSVVAEFVLFAMIVIISTWPMLSLVHALGLRR